MSVLVGKMAPDFTASAVMPNNEINEIMRKVRAENAFFFLH